jgi:hypothetical protein
VLGAHPERVELHLAPQRDRAGDEVAGGGPAQHRARLVPRVDAARAVVPGRGLGVRGVVGTARRGVHAAAPPLVQVGRPQAIVVEAPVAVSDHPLDQIGRAHAGRLRAHGVGTGSSRRGAGSRSGSRSGAGVSRGRAGAGTSIGSTVMRRDGPGSEPLGAFRDGDCMLMTSMLQTGACPADAEEEPRMLVSCLDQFHASPPRAAQ